MDDSPQEPKLIGKCDYCNEEIYEGDAIRIIYSEFEEVHDECYLEYIERILDTEYKIAGED